MDKSDRFVACTADEWDATFGLYRDGRESVALLRPHWITNLRLGDVHWKNARLRVCGKSGREVALPLPRDVAYGLLDYIELTRPRVDVDRVFLTVHAPHRPFASSAEIAHIVRRVLGRACRFGLRLFLRKDNFGNSHRRREMFHYCLSCRSIGVRAA